jgi:type VI secretion system protein ImpB
MDGNQAPARLHITLKDDAEGEVELPLRMLFVGDFMGRDDRPEEDRVPVRIDRDNFPKVLASHAPRLDLVVTPTSGAAAGIGVRAPLTFRSLADFGPDSVAAQVPETARLLAVRRALTELKATGDVSRFRRQIEAAIEDAPARGRLLAAIGVE